MAPILLLGLLLASFGYGVLVGKYRYPPHDGLAALAERLSPPPAPRLALPPVDVAGLIRLPDAAAVAARRAALWRFILGQPTPPVGRLPDTVEAVVEHPFRDLAGIDRAERWRVAMDHGLASIGYFLRPASANGRLLIYHQGHAGGVVLGRDTVDFFLGHGYAVVALAMPLVGENPRPRVEVAGLGPLWISRHDYLPFIPPGAGSPIRYFVEPVLAAVNRAERLGYRDIAMLGLSGGGWTTTLYAALDPRIRYSFPVAGSEPLYSRATLVERHWGDYEQILPGLYRIANYPELYVLGAVGEGRRQLQIFNALDPCCYEGSHVDSYLGPVREALTRLGGGRFQVWLDTGHREHRISDAARERVLAALDEGAGYD